MNESHPTSSPPLATPVSRHGGSAGWYRVATFWCAFGTLELAVASWRSWHEVSGDTASPQPLAAASLALAAICLAVAGVLSLRGRRIAGAAIVVGYLVAVLGNYYPDRGLLAPHLTMVLAMICLIVPSFRP